MALVTLAEVKDYLELNSPDNDARLSNVIEFASTAINSYCGRELEANVYTEYHDGGTNSIFVDRIPINNVTSVAEYDGSTYTDLNGPNSDGSLPANVGISTSALEYMWYAETGEIKKIVNGKSSLRLDLGYIPTFNNYPKGIKVIYGGGYINIPNDIKLGTLDYIKMIHKNESGIESMSFQGESKNAYPLSGNFPPHVRRMLDLYRII